MYWRNKLKAFKRTTDSLISCRFFLFTDRQQLRDFRFNGQADKENKQCIFTLRCDREKEEQTKILPQQTRYGTGNVCARLLDRFVLRNRSFNVFTIDHFPCCRWKLCVAKLYCSAISAKVSSGNYDLSNLTAEKNSSQSNVKVCTMW